MDYADVTIDLCFCISLVSLCSEQQRLQDDAKVCKVISASVARCLSALSGQATTDELKKVTVTFLPFRKREVGHLISFGLLTGEAAGQQTNS